MFHVFQDYLAVFLCQNSIRMILVLKQSKNYRKTELPIMFWQSCISYTDLAHKASVHIFHIFQDFLAVFLCQNSLRMILVLKQSKNDCHTELSIMFWQSRMLYTDLSHKAYVHIFHIFQEFLAVFFCQNTCVEIVKE